MMVNVIYLDFAKAFDKVPHNRLLQKLEGYGVSGRLLAWVGGGCGIDGRGWACRDVGQVGERF